MAVDQDKLHAFLGRAIVDFGATFSAALIRIGDRLGLYKALAKSGPQTPAELAKATGTTEIQNDVHHRRHRIQSTLTSPRRD